MSIKLVRILAMLALVWIGAIASASASDWLAENSATVSAGDTGMQCLIGQPDGNVASWNGDLSDAACCKICTTGKACGDSCINRSYNCTKGAGCACDGVVPDDGLTDTEI